MLDVASIGPPAVVQTHSGKSVAGNVPRSYVEDSIILNTIPNTLPWYPKHMVLPYKTRTNVEHYYVMLCIEGGIILPQDDLKEHLKVVVSQCGMFLDITCSAPDLYCSARKLEKTVEAEKSFDKYERLSILQAFDTYMKESHTTCKSDTDKPLKYTARIPLDDQVERKIHVTIPTVDKKGSCVIAYKLKVKVDEEDDTKPNAKVRYMDDDSPIGDTVFVDNRDDFHHHSPFATLFRPGERKECYARRETQNPLPGKARRTSQDEHTPSTARAASRSPTPPPTTYPTGTGFYQPKFDPNTGERIVYPTSTSTGAHTMASGTEISTEASLGEDDRQVPPSTVVTTSTKATRKRKAAPKLNL